MPRKDEENRIEMAKTLNNIDAIKFGLFKLSSGKVSPYYVDLRIVPSFPDAFKQICNFYSELITNKIGVNSFDRIAGIPMAGLPFASQIAFSLQKPFLYIRKGARLNGRQRRVEGILVSGDRVLLVDDLVTAGLTLKKAAEAVRAEGGVVKNAVVFLDREEGGSELLKENGINLHAFTKISEIANILNDIGAIDQESLQTIMKQIKKK